MVRPVFGIAFSFAQKHISVNTETGNRDGANMILDEKQIAHIQRRQIWMNEYALRKSIDDLIETLRHERDKYKSTEEYVKEGENHE